MSPCMHPGIHPYIRLSIRVDLNVVCVKVNVGLQAKVGQKGETEQVCVVQFFVTCDLHHGLYLLTSTHNILSLNASPSLTNILHPPEK